MRLFKPLIWGGVFLPILSVIRRLIMSSLDEAVKILDGATATGVDTTEAHTPDCPRRTFQAVGSTSAGAGTADVDIEVSNDNSNWLVLGTISLVLSTTETSDGFNSDAPWKHVRGNVTAITGTDATVTVYMGQ
jgi:hypothetical protein